jgi:hypothetical protein
MLQKVKHQIPPLVTTPTLLGLTSLRLALNLVWNASSALCSAFVSRIMPSKGAIEDRAYIGRVEAVCMRRVRERLRDGRGKSVKEREYLYIHVVFSQRMTVVC